MSDRIWHSWSQLCVFRFVSNTRCGLAFLSPLRKKTTFLGFSVPKKNLQTGWEKREREREREREEDVAVWESES